MRRAIVFAGSWAFGLVLSGCLTDGRQEEARAGDAPDPGMSNERIRTEIESASKSSRWITCQVFASGRKEAYSLGVLNKKLEFLPQVAAKLGTQKVSNCDEARLFMKLMKEDPTNELLFGEDAMDKENALEKAEPSPSGQDATQVLPKKSVAGATVANRRGVVTIWIGNYEAICTASMINSRALLTAAHCLDGFVTTGHVGTVEILLDYFDPTLAAGNSRWAGSGPMTVTINPTYAGNGDTQSDIAVITNSTPWIGTSDVDYLGMYYDTMSDARYNNIWGSGYDTDTHYDGLLRYDRIYIDWFGTHHMTDPQNGYRMCDGDSGGPLIRDDSYDIAITGINSSSEGPGACGDQGGTARYNRVSSKVFWVEDVLQLAGIVGSCSIVEIPEGNRRDYMKCF